MGISWGIRWVSDRHLMGYQMGISRGIQWASDGVSDEYLMGTLVLKPAYLDYLNNSLNDLI